MELHAIADKVKELPQKQKMAILELIDIKFSSDMKEVIIVLDKLNNKLDFKYEAINTKYKILIGMISLGMIFIAG